MADVAINFKLTGADSLAEKFKQIGASMDGMKVAAYGFGLAIGGAVLAVGKATLAVADQADRMKELGEKFGLTTEAASKFAYVAEVQGLKIESMGRAFGKLAKDGKDAETAFIELADKIAATADPQEKLRLATEAFGKSGQRLMPILAEGGDAIKKMFKEAEDSGNVFTTKQGEDADKLNENIKRLQLAFQGFTKQALLPLVGEFAKYSETLLRVVKDSGALSKAMTGIVTVFKLVVTAASIISRAFDALGKSIAAVAAALVALAKGEFKQALTIMKENVLDLSDTFKSLKKDLDEVWKDSEKAAGGLGKVSYSMRDVGGSFRMMKAAMTDGGTFLQTAVPTAEQWEDMKEEVRGFARDFSQETARMLVDGEKKWSDYFKRIGQMIAEIIIQKTIARPLEMAVGNALGQAFGGMFGGGGAGPTDGGGEFSTPTYSAAGGGRIPPGRMALVGENGPELMAASGGGRTVYPNDALGGGGGNAFHFHFTGGVTHADMAAIIPQIQQQTISAISQLQRRGGRL